MDWQSDVGWLTRLPLQLVTAQLHHRNEISPFEHLSRKAETAEKLPRAAHGALTGSATLCDDKLATSKACVMNPSMVPADSRPFEHTGSSFSSQITWATNLLAYYSNLKSEALCSSGMYSIGTYRYTSTYTGSTVDKPKFREARAFFTACPSKPPTDSQQ